MRSGVDLQDRARRHRLQREGRHQAARLRHVHVEKAARRPHHLRAELTLAQAQTSAAHGSAWRSQSPGGAARGGARSPGGAPTSSSASPGPREGPSAATGARHRARRQARRRAHQRRGRRAGRADRGRRGRRRLRARREAEAAARALVARGVEPRRRPPVCRAPPIARRQGLRAGRHRLHRAGDTAPGADGAARGPDDLSARRPRRPPGRERRRPIWRARFAGKPVAIVHDASLLRRRAGREPRSAALKQAGPRRRPHRDHRRRAEGLRPRSSPSSPRPTREAVFFAGFPIEGGLLLRQMRAAGLDTVFLGSDALATPQFAETAGEDADRRGRAAARTTPRTAPAAQGGARRFRGRRRRARSSRPTPRSRPGARPSPKPQSLEPAAVAAALQQGTFDTVLGPLSFDENGRRRRSLL